VARVTAEQFQEKHNRRLKAALEDVRTGVARVTVAPGTQAAARKDKMLARLTEAVNSGKWGRNVARVSLTQWQALMTDKGIPRISGGIDAAADKVKSFAGQLLPFEDALMTTVGKMPDLTLEDSIARAQAWIRGMAKFKMT
jgi:hypothetical protein